MRQSIFRLVLLLTLLISAAVFAQDDDLPDLTPPTLGDFDPATIEDIDITAPPVMPEVTDHTRTIFERGQENGQQAGVLSKIGDCMTASVNFLAPFSISDYDLGEYSELQPVIDHFTAAPARPEGFEADAFANPGLATASGYNTASVLDPLWADPTWCLASESPLACEYRVSRPAFSLIMFGTNDVFFFDAASFDYYYRQIVIETIESDIVPVLYTFPFRPEFPDKSVEFNQVIIRIAQDYDLPLINLYRALEDLPDQGVDLSDPIHLSLPADGDAGTGIFTPENLEAGYTLRNLLTLQALDLMLAELMPTSA